MNSLNKRVCFLAIFLGLMIVLTSCSLGLAKKTRTPEVKTSNLATTTEKISTTTEGRISSSTDDMSNWKTYSNKIIGIEFKYPPTWPDLKMDKLICPNMENNPNCFFMSFPGGHVSKDALTFDNLPKDIPNSKFVCPKELAEFATCNNKVSDNGVNYYIETEHVEMYNDVDHYAFIGTGKTIVLFSFQGSENYNKRVDEYEKLLSSLKILE